MSIAHLGQIALSHLTAGGALLAALAFGAAVAAPYLLT